MAESHLSQQSIPLHTFKLITLSGNHTQSSPVAPKRDTLLARSHHDYRVFQPTNNNLHAKVYAKPYTSQTRQYITDVTIIG